MMAAILIFLVQSNEKMKCVKRQNTKISNVIIELGYLIL